MFEKNSFIRKRVTAKSSERWSAFVREQTSSPYSVNFFMHAVFGTFFL